MTREEEIVLKAIEFYPKEEIKKGDEFSGEMRNHLIVLFRMCFKEGAEWADKHPSCVSVKDGLSPKRMKNSDKYNVVIKDQVIHATVNSVSFEMTLDDFNKFSQMVTQASKSDLGAAFIDDEGVAHSLFTSNMCSNK